MGCKQLRADLNFAWPTSEIAVMGASGAVAVLCAKEAKTKEDPKSFLAEKEEEYTEMFANPYQAPLAPITAISDVGHAKLRSARSCLHPITIWLPP